MWNRASLEKGAGRVPSFPQMQSSYLFGALALGLWVGGGLPAAGPGSKALPGGTQLPGLRVAKELVQAQSTSAGLTGPIEPVKKTRSDLPYL